jgi:hypothetical protein
MVLDFPTKSGTCHVGFSSSRMFVAFEGPAPQCHLSALLGVGKRPGQKVRTGLRFELKVLRSGWVVAPSAAHNGKRVSVALTWEGY